MGGNIKAVIVIVLIFVGFGAYKWYKRPVSPACQAYEKFAEHWAKAEWKEAEKLAIGDALNAVDEASQPIMTAGGPAYPSQMTEQAAGRVQRVWHRIEYEKASDDGTTVDIVAVQGVYRYRAGDRAAGGGVTNKFRQTVQMKYTYAGWMVTSFKEEYLGKE
jgi:hypothetical protein